VKVFDLDEIYDMSKLDYDDRIALLWQLIDKYRHGYEHYKDRAEMLEEKIAELTTGVESDII
jgi:hypothetical protein